jgi:transposase
MSLRPNGFTEIPAETSRVARAAFPKECLVMRVRDALGPLFTDEQFSELFAARGRPAWSPARLALVLVLQFVEGLTERQAADAVRARLDWKYALGLDLRDPGFDATVLTEFRVRLLANGQAERLPTLMLHRLRERGLLGKGGASAPMPPTSVWRSVICTGWNRSSRPSAPRWRPGDRGAGLAGRADPARVGATLWAARRRLAAAQGRARPHRPGHSGWSGRLVLLEAVYAPDAPAGLAGVEAVQVLRATWIQQFYLEDGQVRWRDKHSGLKKCPW